MGAEATASLIWAGCRPDPDLGSAEAARVGGADLAWAARAAIGHRLSGLLWRVVRSWAEGEDGTWAKELGDDAKRALGQALMLVPRLGAQLLEPLSEGGVRPLVWKGAALSDRYPAPGLRPMDDVDLIVPEDQLAGARDLLSRAGWQEVPQHDPDHEKMFVHPAFPGLPVEVHAELAPSSERFSRLRAADLWRDRQATTVAGVEVFGLPAEVELVALVDHAAKPFHTFGRLIWAVDLCVVVEAATASGRSIDWERVESLADDARARTALAVALTQAAHLGADVPRRLLEAPASRARRAALAPLVSRAWPLYQMDGSQRERVAFALMDDPKVRLVRAYADVTAGGPGELPRRVTNLATRAARKWWSLRAQQPAHRPSSRSPEG